MADSHDLMPAIRAMADDALWHLLALVQGWRYVVQYWSEVRERLEWEGESPEGVYGTIPDFPRDLNAARVLMDTLPGWALGPGCPPFPTPARYAAIVYPTPNTVCGAEHHNHPARACCYAWLKYHLGQEGDTAARIRTAMKEVNHG